MHHFSYRHDVLHAEGVDLQTLAQDVGTPTYVYSSATLNRHFDVLSQAFAGLPTLIAYSVKANGNLGVLRTLAARGSGADVVSGGELYRAVAARVPPHKIVFSGVGKSAEDLRYALSVGIRLFNVESLPELERLNGLALEAGTRAPMAFRVNPHVAAGGHANISTGKPEDKFGVAWHEAGAFYAHAAHLAGVEPVGVDVHIGSQIFDLAPLREATAKVVSLARDLRAQGLPIQVLDAGGGLGIAYSGADDPASPDAYAQMLGEELRGTGLELILEPGRVIVGNAGVMLARVEYVKERDGRRFLILDAGMNDLLRPALYGAHHEILPVVRDASRPVLSYDVVGPVCETTDRFAVDRALPEMRAGELVALMSAGAYGAAMASSYNARPLAAEVLVARDDAAVVRRRASREELIALEAVPRWLS
jgi:diaminopimelate decarboxylase